MHAVLFGLHVLPKKLSAQRQKDVAQAKQFLDAAKELAKKLSNMKGSEKKDNPASQVKCIEPVLPPPPR